MKQFTQPMLNIRLWGFVALAIGILALGAAVIAPMMNGQGGDLDWLVGIMLKIAVILQITLLLILLIPASNAMMKLIGRMRSDEEVPKELATRFAGQLIMAIGLGMMGVVLTMASIAIGTNLLASGLSGFAVFAGLFVAFAAVEFWCILRPLIALQKKFSNLRMPSA